MKKAVITSVIDTTRTFDHPQYGVTYYFAITFDNGDTGEAGCKTNPQTTWVVGQSVDYEIVPNSNPQYASKIKKINPNFDQSGGNKGGGFSKAKISETEKYPSFAYAYVKDLIVADKAKIKDIKKLAESMFDGMIELHAKLKPEPGPVVTTQATAPTVTPPAIASVPPAEQVEATQKFTAEQVEAEAKRQETSEELPF